MERRWSRRARHPGPAGCTDAVDPLWAIDGQGRARRSALRASGSVGPHPAAHDEQAPTSITVPVRLTRSTGVSFRQRSPGRGAVASAAEKPALLAFWLRSRGQAADGCRTAPLGSLRLSVKGSWWKRIAPWSSLACRSACPWRDGAITPELVRRRDGGRAHASMKLCLERATPQPWGGLRLPRKRPDPSPAPACRHRDARASRAHGLHVPHRHL